MLPEHMESMGQTALEHAFVFAWLSRVFAGGNPLLNWEEVEDQLTRSGEKNPALKTLGELIRQEREKNEGTGTESPGPTSLLWESERLRLFVTSPDGIPLPPYGSWWMEGHLMGATTVSVAGYYEKEGLTSETGPADFLSAELEFLHLLIFRQFKSETPGSFIQDEAKFMEECLLPWIPRFCAAGRKNTSVPFWELTFETLESSLQAEQSRLKRLLSPLGLGVSKIPAFPDGS